MSILIFPGPKSEEDKMNDMLKELDELYNQFREAEAEARAWLKYHEETGFRYANMKLINERIKKRRITERPVAHKISSYAEIIE